MLYLSQKNPARFLFLSALGLNLAVSQPTYGMERTEQRAPLIQGRYGEQGLRYEVLDKLIADGKVILTLNGEIQHNEYNEGTTYYLISVSHPTSDTDHGQYNVWNWRKISLLYDLMPDAMKRISKAAENFCGPIDGPRKILYDNPCETMYLDYDGHLDDYTAGQVKYYFYHYKSKYIKDPTDHKKIQLCISNKSPSRKDFVQDSFASWFINPVLGKKHPFLEKAPEIRSRGHFVSLKTTDPVQAARDPDSFRLLSGVKAPHKYRSEASSPFHMFLFNDVYTILGEKGHVYLTNDGCAYDQPYEGYAKYNLVGVLFSKNMENPQDSYEFLTDKDAQDYLSQNPLTSKQKVEYDFPRNRLVLLGSAKVNGQNCCIYQYKAGFDPNSKYFPVQIFLSEAQDEEAGESISLTQVLEKEQPLADYDEEHESSTSSSTQDGADDQTSIVEEKGGTWFGWLQDRFWSPNQASTNDQPDSKSSSDTDGDDDEFKSFTDSESE